VINNSSLWDTAEFGLQIAAAQIFGAAIATGMCREAFLI
jgi:hypothetical protein